MSTEENAVKEPTDAEQMTTLQLAIEEAETRLRALRFKERGVTIMKRGVWDKLSDAQREALAPQLIGCKLSIED